MNKARELKVCFLAGTLGRGGAERQLIYMLKALTTAGIPTRVLCLTKGEALENEILEMGIPVTWVGKSKWKPVRLCQIILEVIREPALLTIEGELDDISGNGQTEAAHALCLNIPRERRAHFLAPGVGHYGIFSGRRWREVVFPRVRDFIAAYNS